MYRCQTEESYKRLVMEEFERRCGTKLDKSHDDASAVNAPDA
jgi:hypothetical protein